MPATRKSKHMARGLRGTITVLKRQLAALESWPLLEGYKAAREGKPDDSKQSASWREGWRRGAGQMRKRGADPAAVEDGRGHGQKRLRPRGSSGRDGHTGERGGRSGEAPGRQA